jgi:hypothetical protein
LPDRAVKRFAAEGVAEFQLSELNERTVFELANSEKRIDITTSPDGLVELVTKSPSAQVIVAGPGGSRVDICLRPDERISVRPAEKVAASVSGGIIKLDVGTSDWSFAVQAEDVRAGGLPVLCDDMACVLRSGDRLETERLASRVTFLVSGSPGQGRLVKLLASSSRSSTSAGKKTEGVAGRSASSIPGPVPPGVFDDRSRDFPWQSVPLPTIKW